MPPPNPRKPRPGGAPKAGGDPSIRRRKQVARKYGAQPDGDRHDDGGRGDDFHDAPPRAPRAARPTGQRPDAKGAPPKVEAPRQEPTRATPSDEPVRLNRFLARAGIASRREADAIITSGRVTVNGAVVTEMGVQVAPADRVQVDGRPIGPVGLTYILMNKPTGAVTTTSDERGRRTVMDLLDLPPHELDGLFPVGRLDRNTSGALLFTTDGDLAHRLMHPRYETVKHYMCRTERPLTDADLDQLLAGVALDDGPAKADQAQFLGPDRTVVALGLHEGRNRQVRRMIEAIGHRVEALERVGYAGLTLEGLRRGKWRRLQPHEVNALRRKVKLKAIVYDPK
jgi:23S rRNA pseudouridine2605 synthase